MAGMTAEQFSQLPDEMRMFTILSAVEGVGPRLGRLFLPGRALINTPHYIGNTSRGAVPHLSQDMFRKHTSLNAVPEVIEKAPRQTPPIFKLELKDGESPLRRFIALPQEAISIMGARRNPPIPCPTANTNSAVSILTSVGYRQLDVQDYVAAAQKLRPDIVVGLGDVAYGQKPSPKRIDKMSDRTVAWTKDVIAGKSGLDKTKKSSVYRVFAPILPVAQELQSYYLDQLIDEMQEHVSGLAFYDADTLDELPQSLRRLPRLSFDDPASPSRLLHEISLGMDLFTIPFIGAATDAGVALDFSFPAPAGSRNDHTPVPLGIDMWPAIHATDLSPLRTNCECYTCKKHHRAYLQHLLAAKEMLGWVLLQVHNHRVMDDFFVEVRASIEAGKFEEDKRVFESYYEAELPEKTGQGPRVRGYQYKSEGPGPAKKNPSAYRMLDDANEKLAEAPVPSPGTDGKDLEETGFAESA